MTESRWANEPDGERAYLYADSQIMLYTGLGDLFPAGAVSLSRLVVTKQGCTYLVQTFGLTVAQFVEVVTNVAHGDLAEVDRLIAEIPARSRRQI